MARVRLSAAFIDKVAPPQAGRVEYHDTEVPGLVLRVTAAGVKSYSLTYRFRGVLRRLTLGQHPGLTLKEARERGREARGSIQRGEDPVEEKKADERERTLNSFRSCLTEFIERYAKKRNKTWWQKEQMLNRLALPYFGDRPVREITRRDMADLIDKVASETPYQSNLLRAYLSKMWNWMVEREIVDANPVTGVAPRQKVIPRDRILTDDEIAAFWRATERMGGVFGAAAQLLLLTGMRKNEVARLRWDELDLEGGWANLPGSRMKAGRSYKAPLSARAKAIIEARPRLEFVKDGQRHLSPWVFTTDGEHPVQAWSQAKAQLDRLMSEELKRKVDRFVIHDLRRTVGSALARFGYSIEVRKRVLAHVPRVGNVTESTYTWNSWDDEAREAMSRWSAHVGRLTSGLKAVPAA
jgi:integrase